MAKPTPSIPTPEPPVIGGVPDIEPSVVPSAEQVINPVTPVGRIYVSTQGDWWDLIALKVYGMRRGDDHLMHKLIEANYPLRDVCNFPGGVIVIVPDVPVRTEIALVPWKKASIITQ